MIVLIPAYQPGLVLVDLVEALADHARVLVVDDGSGPDYVAVFDRAREAGAAILIHAVNRGKGAALRTGFAEALRSHPGEDVVTADADGQHTVGDILRVGATASEDDATLILGCRAFHGPHIPLRSRAGNVAARAVFGVAAGWRLSDTQTGLRGIPATMLPWMLSQRGDRFEYEQNVLLRCRRAGWRTREVPIETVYVGDNDSSHFRPLVDSVRVALPLLLFTASSLLAFTVDTVVLLVLTALTGWLIPSIVAARLMSASLNFALNRRVVFPTADSVGGVRAVARYAAVAAVLLATNIAGMSALTLLGVPVVLAKLVTEGSLLVLGYLLQRNVVFRPRDGGNVESGVNAPLRNGEGALTRMVSATNTTRRIP